MAADLKGMRALTQRIRHIVCCIEDEVESSLVPEGSGAVVDLEASCCDGLLPEHHDRDPPSALA